MAADDGGRGPGAPVRAGRDRHPPRSGRARRALRRHHARHRHRRAAERWPQVGRGRGGGRHGRQGAPGAGGALDRLPRGRRRTARMARGPRQPGPLLGPAPLGRPEDVALVLDQFRRRQFRRRQRRGRHALRGHPARHRRRRSAPGLGVGRVGGHLGGRVAGHDRAGRRRGDAQGRAPRRRRQARPHLPAAGRRAARGRHRPVRRHHGQRGPGALDLQDAGGAARTGYGICEYLHQLDDSGRPVVPVE